MPRKQTPRQTAHSTYMMDVMRRLEWDLHNTVELTGRIPEAWHEIARATPRTAKQRVNLALETDVLRFFRSMGEGYGPRINDVLKSYMHARLAGLIRGAETTNHHRKRQEDHDGDKPAFGDMARALGETWEDDGPAVPEALRARWVEAMQKRHAKDGLPDGAGVDIRLR